MYKPVDAWALWRLSKSSAGGGQKRRKKSGTSASSGRRKAKRRRSKSSSSLSTSLKRKAVKSLVKFGSDAWHRKYKTGKYKKK